MNAESSNFVEDAIYYILNALDKEDLKSLLSKDEEWEKFVTDTELSREEAQAMREGLKNQKTATGVEFKEMPQYGLEYRERFLKTYPEVKEEVEKLIAQFHALTDSAMQVHRDTIIPDLIIHISGLTNRILCIVQTGLDPLMTGVSLALTTTRLGLGVAAVGKTGITTEVKFGEMSSIGSEAKHLGSSGLKVDELFLGVVNNSPNRIATAVSSRNRVARHIRVVRSTQCRPLAEENATESNNVLGNMFGSILRGMSEGDRFCFGANTDFSLLVEIHSLTQELLILLNNPKSAEILKQRVPVLESILEELKQVYERLQ
ncbi:apolipoprotein L2-like [Sorex araneus]|uniref:apolipoprotein L2-like n=1 Tax=Sorex araneus TaxID=42254 RepID=UPI002433399C|nr:apolipoprotein L2-like [Sorex araneus]